MTQEVFVDFEGYVKSVCFLLRQRNEEKWVRKPMHVKLKFVLSHIKKNDKLIRKFELSGTEDTEVLEYSDDPLNQVLLAVWLFNCPGKLIIDRETMNSFSRHKEPWLSEVQLCTWVSQALQESYAKEDMRCQKRTQKIVEGILRMEEPC